MGDPGKKRTVVRDGPAFRFHASHGMPSRQRLHAEGLRTEVLNEMLLRNEGFEISCHSRGQEEAYYLFLGAL